MPIKADHRYILDQAFFLRIAKKQGTIKTFCAALLEAEGISSSTYDLSLNAFLDTVEAGC